MDISVDLLMKFQHICINFCANCLNRRVLQAGYQLTSRHHAKYFERSVSSIYVSHSLFTFTGNIYHVLGKIDQDPWGPSLTPQSSFGAVY
jgi:hypothetical protein